MTVGMNQVEWRVTGITTKLLIRQTSIMTAMSLIMKRTRIYFSKVVVKKKPWKYFKKMPIRTPQRISQKEKERAKVKVRHHRWKNVDKSW